MKVLFHCNEINFRGTTVAVLDYAKYNQEILGNESVISYFGDRWIGNDGGNEPTVIDYFKTLFDVRPVYNNNFNPTTKDVDFAYYIRWGTKDILPDNCRTGVHAVFQSNDPHGDRYAYISEWLSQYMSNGAIPFVPHMIDLPNPTVDLRTLMQIDKDKKVIGRFGGFTTFDLAVGHQAVYDVLQKRDDYVFVFLNTQKFIEHPNVIYLNATHDRRFKSNYINMCDAFIHARSFGESFGLSVCESLWFNKPTFCFNGGNDHHHIMLLNDSDLLYDDTTELVDKLCSLDSFQDDYHSIVEKFNPKTVMDKFNKVFLS